MATVMACDSDASISLRRYTTVYRCQIVEFVHWLFGSPHLFCVSLCVRVISAGCGHHCNGGGS